MKSLFIFSFGFLSALFCQLFTAICFSQNLVPNPSFEQFDTCPNNFGQIYRVIPWFQPTPGTSDYYNACDTTSVYGYVDVPQNLFGFQNAKTGNAYAGFYASYTPWWNTYREYVQVQLLSPLTASEKYYISFFVSLSDSSAYTTDAIGLYFSTDSVLASNYDTLPVIPQIKNPNANYIIDKINWTLISGEYVAQGGEKFITIGNFKNNSNTTSILIGDTMNATYNGAYYYLDDVCISTDSSTCNPTGINEHHISNSITIYPNPCVNKIYIVSSKNIYKIEINNLLGEVMFTEPINEKKEMEINISSFQNGMYLLKIYQNQSVNTCKISINH